MVRSASLRVSNHEATRRAVIIRANGKRSYSLLHAAGERLERGTDPQRVPSRGDDVVDLLGRQPEAGGNGLEHSGARRVQLIEAQATDEELQVMAIPARTRAVSGAFRRRQAATPFDQGSLPIAHGAVERREAVADAGIDA